MHAALAVLAVFCRFHRPAALPRRRAAF